MDTEIFKNELEKLEKDKKNIEMRIVQLREELMALEKNRDVISGAMQTCNYFLKLSEEQESSESEN